jgi:hypothetical protein
LLGCKTGGRPDRPRHVLGIKLKDAAAFLIGTGTSTVPSTGSRGTVPDRPQSQKAGSNPPSPGIKPLDYLQHDHPAVEAIGFEAETAKALGVGFAPRGTMSGLVLIPVRLETGELAGYIGITEAKLPRKFFLDTTVVPFPKRTA